MKLLPFALLAGVLLLGAAAGGSAPPGPARVTGLTLAAEDQELVVGFNLVDLFGAELQERLDSGLPTSVVYEIELLRRRTWFDKTLARGRLRMIAMWNALTREYLLNVKLDGELIESRVLRDRQELWQAMTRVERLELFDLRERPRDERLQLRVRAELGTTTTFLFIPRVVHTDWATSPTFRPADLPAPASP
jgi:hypothetical protein